MQIVDVPAIDIPDISHFSNQTTIVIARPRGLVCCRSWHVCDPSTDPNINTAPASPCGARIPRWTNGKLTASNITARHRRRGDRKTPADVAYWPRPGVRGNAVGCLLWKEKRTVDGYSQYCRATSPSVRHASKSSASRTTGIRGRQLRRQKKPQAPLIGAGAKTTHVGETT